MLRPVEERPVPAVGYALEPNQMLRDRSRDLRHVLDRRHRIVFACSRYFGETMAVLIPQSTIDEYTMFFNCPRKLNVADGISCVMKITTRSSFWSTQKIVDAAPPQ